MTTSNKVMGLENLVDKLGRRIVFTTAQYSAPVNKKALESLETYVSHNNAELYILPMVGSHADDKQVLAKELVDKEILLKDYKVNNSLKVKDFGVRPQQINPLTGLERFAQGDSSYIMPGTKQVLKYVANSYDEIPKAILTTGAITKPNYRMTTKSGFPIRISRIAKEDHEYGFVVAEIDDDKYFHFRQVTMQTNGKFSDLGVVYNGNCKPRFERAKALVVGDLHPYDTDPEHESCTKEQIKTLKPKALFFHDTFNGKSISHHYKGHNVRKYEVSKEQGLDLEEELRFTNEKIREYASLTKSPLYIVYSNHDEHLFRYLDEGRFIGDSKNELIASVLYTATLQGYNPLEYGLNYIKPLPSNVKFLRQDSDFKIAGYQLGNHGHLGSNGGKGSVRSIENANGKSITAHGHSAFKMRNTYKVGTSTHLRLDYNHGYSNWTQTNAVIDSLGKVQLYNTINSKWRR